MLGEIIEQNRRVKPLIHCINNYVSANDCANILLACGGSAIMADDEEEVSEVTGMCGGLVLNMGTPNPGRLRAMMLAGKEANRLGHPVILDPVGVGCSRMRKDAARQLLENIRFSSIRANATEISTLVCGASAHRGVDADIGEAVTDAAFQNAVLLSQKMGAIVVVTGENDIVTDGKTTYRVRNGHPMMRSVTGAGCQLSALLGAYIASNPERKLWAALAAVCAMGLCGEIARGRLGPMDGNAAFKNYIIDAVYSLAPDALEKGARYEAYK